VLPLVGCRACHREYLPSSGISGGGATVLFIFQMTADMHCLLCLGSVGNGLKFCVIDIGSLYILSGRNSAFACHSIKAGLLSVEQLSLVQGENTHKRRVGVPVPPLEQSSRFFDRRARRGVQRSIHHQAGQARMFGGTARGYYYLNLSEYSLLENVEGGQGKAEDVAPDLVLLSSSSSEDKTQEEWLEDIIQSWDSLVHTIKVLSSSLRSIQKKHSQFSETVDERTSSLESIVGHCSEHQLKEDYITIWDAISFLHSGLEAMGKSLADLQSSKLTEDNSLRDKVKALEDSAQITFNKISQSFQEMDLA